MTTPSPAHQESQRGAWDLGRFVQTLAFFETLPVLGNWSQWGAWVAPFLPVDLSTAAVTPQGTVLVIGATGKLGQAVVKCLLASHYRVKALVRDLPRGQQLLAPQALAQPEQLILISGDVTQAHTLPPDLFTGVDAVISCLGAIVGNRNPDLTEPSPEQVEYHGLQNLLQLAPPRFRDPIPERVIFDFRQPSSALAQQWGALDDVVMGGVSASGLRFSSSSAQFTGTVSTANSGGFASIRTKNFQPPLDLSAYTELHIRLKGDGQRYKFFLRSSPAWDGVGYAYAFNAVANQWQTVTIPFSQLTPVFRAKRAPNAPPFDPGQVYSFQLMLSKFEYDGALNPYFRPGAFALEMESITAAAAQKLPRWIMVSSAGVTKTGTPEAATDPRPIVRLSQELGDILAWKYEAERLIRHSGIPYTIIRPTALTEDPGNQPLIMAQGDYLAGKVSRVDVANLCVQALKWSGATDKTLEIAQGDGGIVPQDWGRGLELLKVDAGDSYSNPQG